MVSCGTFKSRFFFLRSKHCSLLRIKRKREKEAKTNSRNEEKKILRKIKLHLKSEFISIFSICILFIFSCVHYVVFINNLTALTHPVFFFSLIFRFSTYHCLYAWLDDSVGFSVFLFGWLLQTNFEEFCQIFFFFILKTIWLFPAIYR